MSDMETIIKFEGCDGILAWNKYSLKLPFDLIVSVDGEIRIDLGSQPLTNDNIWIEIAFLQKGDKAEVLMLEGTTSEGYILRSDSIYLTKSGIFSDQNGSVITAEATASQIDIRVLKEASTTIGEMQVDFLIAGLQCFRPIKIDHEVGEIYIAGSSKIKDFSRICGIVSVKKQITANDDYNKWLELVKEQVRRVQDLLSFANGRFLRTNVLKVFQGRELSNIILFRIFSKARPYKPPFSYLHLQPLIEIAVKGYTNDLIRKTGMDVALEWHLMPHTYNEDRYLGQMTALEHLVHVFREQKSSNRALQKAKFRNIVRPALEEKLDELLPQLCDGPQEIEHFENVIKELKAKIGNLNMQTLLSSLQSMLAEYRVPMDGLNEFIPDLIKVRNEIVHRGLHVPSSEQDSLNEYVSAAEELLRRIFLSLLDYDGTYQTYFEVVQDRPFHRLPLKSTG